MHLSLKINNLPANPIIAIPGIMKKISYIPMVTLLAIITSCNTKPAETSSDGTLPASNPFAAASTLPYQAPAFDKIKNADFKPAMEAGMAQQLTEIKKIADNTEAPTFENTLVEMEKSGQLLTRVNLVLNLLTGANTNPDLQKLQEEVAPKLAATEDAVFLDTKLFKRVEAVYKDRDKLKLDTESERLLEFYYQKFELAGANLSHADKDKMKKFNGDEASLSAKFTNKLLGAAKAGALVISDKAELAGLPQGTLDAAAQSAKAAKMDGKWLLPLQNTTQQPALQSLTNRATRQKLFEASWTRAEKKDTNDTRDIISHIAQIRAQKAKLMGFKNYAEWKLQDQMAKTPEAVDKFLAQVVPAATARAKAEAADIQAVIDQQDRKSVV